MRALLALLITGCVACGAGMAYALAHLAILLVEHNGVPAVLAMGAFLVVFVIAFLAIPGDEDL
jgi:tetrahydromethanopterin S-methyltransferase subunit D